MHTANTNEPPPPQAPPRRCACGCGRPLQRNNRSGYHRHAFRDGTAYQTSHPFRKAESVRKSAYFLRQRQALLQKQTAKRTGLLAHQAGKTRAELLEAFHILLHTGKRSPGRPRITPFRIGDKVYAVTKYHPANYGKNHDLEENPRGWESFWLSELVRVREGVRVKPGEPRVMQDHENRDWCIVRADCLRVRARGNQ